MVDLSTLSLDGALCRVIEDGPRGGYFRFSRVSAGSCTARVADDANPILGHGDPRVTVDFSDFNSRVTAKFPLISADA